MSAQAALNLSDNACESDFRVVCCETGGDGGCCGRRHYGTTFVAVQAAGGWWRWCLGLGQIRSCWACVGLLPLQAVLRLAN